MSEVDAQETLACSDNDDDVFSKNSNVCFTVAFDEAENNGWNVKDSLKKFAPPKRPGDTPVKNESAFSAADRSLTYDKINELTDSNCTSQQNFGDDDIVSEAGTYILEAPCNVTKNVELPQVNNKRDFDISSLDNDSDERSITPIADELFLGEEAISKNFTTERCHSNSIHSSISSLNECGITKSESFSHSRLKGKTSLTKLEHFRKIGAFSQEPKSKAPTRPSSTTYSKTPTKPNITRNSFTMSHAETARKLSEMESSMRSQMLNREKTTPGRQPTSKGFQRSFSKHNRTELTIPREPVSTNKSCTIKLNKATRLRMSKKNEDDGQYSESSSIKSFGNSLSTFNRKNAIYRSLPEKSKKSPRISSTQINPQKTLNSNKHISNSATCSPKRSFAVVGHASLHDASLRQCDSQEPGETVFSSFDHLLLVSIEDLTVKLDSLSFAIVKNYCDSNSISLNEELEFLPVVPRLKTGCKQLATVLYKLRVIEKQLDVMNSLVNRANTPNANVDDSDHF